MARRRWNYERVMDEAHRRPDLNFEYVRPEDVENSRSKLPIECVMCEHQWYSDIQHIFSPSSMRGCSSCSGNIQWNFSRLERYIHKHRPEINISQICDDDVENNRSRLSVSCNDCEYEWITTLNSIVNSQSGCSRCSGREKWTYSRFKAYMRKYRPEINISQICEEDVVNNKSRLTFSCYTCEYEWETSLHAIVNHNSGCSRCSGKEPITYDIFLQRIHTRPDVDFSLTKERHIDTGNESKLKCRCVRCKYVWRPSFNSIFDHNSGCPVCCSSKGEKAVKKYLEDHNVTYEREVTLESLPRKRYDFRFVHEEIGYLLEFDGLQHFEQRDHFHREEDSFEEGQKVDRRKTRHALRNGYRLIRIDYTQVDNVNRHIRRALRSEENLYLSNPEMYSYLS